MGGRALKSIVTKRIEKVEFRVINISDTYDLRIEEEYGKL